MTDPIREHQEQLEHQWNEIVAMIENAATVDAESLTDDELVERINMEYRNSDHRYGPETADMKRAYERLTGYCAEARRRGRPQLAEQGRQRAREFLGINARHEKGNQ